MEDLLEDFQLRAQVDVLLLGVGDIRHILKTVGGVSVRADRVDGTPPPSCIRLVINDCDAALIARDILLLKIVTDIDASKMKDIEFLWDVWYNRTLLKSHYQRLKDTLHELVQGSAASSGRDPLWTYGDTNTHNKVLRILTLWLKHKNGDSSDKAGMMTFSFPHLLLYSDSDEFLDAESKYFEGWMSYEANKSARDPNKDERKEDVRSNPTMYRPGEMVNTTAVDVRPWFSYFPLERYGNVYSQH